MAIVKITRQQLARVFTDPELIRAFEQLFLTVNDTTEVDLTEIWGVVGSGQQQADLQPLLNRIEELEIQVNQLLQMNADLVTNSARIKQIAEYLGV